MVRVPIQLATTVKIIDIIKTLTKQLTIILARKESSRANILRVTCSAGRCVSSTSATTTTQIIGRTVSVCCQVRQLNPTSKHVINGAITLTEITEIIKINQLDSYRLRGNFKLNAIFNPLVRPKN